MQNDEFIFLGHDNTIDIQLLVNGTSITHNSLIRAQVIFKNPSIAAVTLDSNISPALFDLTKTDRISLKFGQAALTPGRYSATLVIFDAGDPNGLVWGNFPVTVQS